MTVVVISQPLLFPWVGMYEQLELADVWVHYDDVQFSSGSFVNRVQCKTPSGPRWLTIPLKDRALGDRIDQLRPADDRPWRQSHRQLLRDAYSEAPWYDTMIDVVDGTYARVGAPLAEIVIDGFDRLATRLGVTPPATVARSSTLGVQGRGSQRVLDVVLHLGGTRYVTAQGALDYLDFAAFDEAGVEVRIMDYARAEYPQLHGDFTPFVSALDLLAMTGPDARDYLQPRTVYWNDFTPDQRVSGKADHGR